MRHKKLKLIATVLLYFGITGLCAQEVSLTSGGNVSGSGGSVSYSIGQIVYKTNGSVASGIQQPYEISVESGIKEFNEITLQCVVYPNPSSDYINLNIKNLNTKNLNYQLYNNNGKLLEKKNIKSSETRIVISNLLPAIYFLKVNDKSKNLKTFKIIKK